MFSQRGLGIRTIAGRYRRRRSVGAVRAKHGLHISDLLRSDAGIGHSASFPPSRHLVIRRFDGPAWKAISFNAELRRVKPWGVGGAWKHVRQY